MKKSKNTGYFEQSPGNRSLIRLLSFLAFIFISLPINYIIILGTFENFGSLTWQDLTFGISIFIAVNLLWIAPKVLQKAIEENGLLSKFIAQKRREEEDK